MSFFQDKVIVITGGSEGIGKALIETLIPLGAKVATCARNHDKLYQLQMTYARSGIHTVACDVSKEQDCKRFIESTIKTFGGIDILINNAGISMRALVKDVDVEVMRKVMDINFFGAVYCTKFALPSITERKGTIVGISSIAGYRVTGVFRTADPARFAAAVTEVLPVEVQTERDGSLTLREKTSSAG